MRPSQLRASTVKIKKRVQTQSGFTGAVIPRLPTLARITADCCYTSQSFRLLGSGTRSKRPKLIRKIVFDVLTDGPTSEPSPCLGAKEPLLKEEENDSAPGGIRTLDLMIMRLHRVS